MHVSEVVFYPSKNKYVVNGDDIPEQTIHITELDEWHGIRDNEGNEIWEMQVWIDDDLGEVVYGCQYVNLIEIDGEIHMGHDWYNPDKFIVK